VKEEALLFGKHKNLVGVVTDPTERNHNLPAILLLNAGLIHRVGPNRLYVRLARYLSELGFVVMRFDLSGIGDSNVRPDNMPIEKSSVDDTRQAMDYLENTRSVKQFLVMGHCAGAIHSIMAASEDKRVTGIVMINLEGGGDNWQDYDKRRKVGRYYKNYYSKQAISDPQRWRRFFTGKADYRSIYRNIVYNILLSKLTNTMFRLKTSFAQQRTQADSLHDKIAEAIYQLAMRHIQLLFVYSEASTGLERMRITLGSKLRDLVEQDKLRLEIVPHSDHLFTLAITQEHLMGILGQWSQQVSQTQADEIAKVSV